MAVTIDWSSAPWRKSVNSDSGGCVEVARIGDVIGVRDTKAHGTGPVLEFNAQDEGIARLPIAQSRLKEGGNIVRQNGGVTNVDHTAVGDYVVHTSSDVSTCIYLATTGKTADGTAGMTRTYLGSNNTSIVVETYFTHTAQEDMEFNLGVDC